MLTTLPNAFGDASTNMAIDTTLLESIPDTLVLFRHYGWLEPSITFGYAQNFSAIQAQVDSELTLCRRTTGGGIVDHRNDWTYALVAGSTTKAAQTTATEFYAVLHKSIQEALSKTNIPSKLAPCPRHCDEQTQKSPHASECFTSPAANDVLRPDNRKIAGAAMRRNRKGLLVQGSIDRGALPDDFDFTHFQTELTKILASRLDLRLGELDDYRPLLNGAKIQKEKERFDSDSWTKRR